MASLDTNWATQSCLLPSSPIWEVHIMRVPVDEHREHVRTRTIGDASGGGPVPRGGRNLAGTVVGIDDEDLVVPMSHLAGRVEQVGPGRMPEGRPVHVRIVGDLELSLEAEDPALVVDVELTHEELEVVVVVAIGSVGSAVRRGRRDRRHPGTVTSGTTSPVSGP